MNSPQDDPAVLLLVTDNRHARLLSCERLPSGHVHVTALSALKEQWDEEVHKQRSSRAGASGHSYQNVGHTAEERVHRFAKEIATWLGKELPKHVFDQLFLFAEARVLGALRKEAPASVQQKWIEHQTDLAGLSEGELAHRPEIAALVPVAKT